jgi:hypothetical protein
VKTKLTGDAMVTIASNPLILNAMRMNLRRSRGLYYQISQLTGCTGSLQFDSV